MAKISGELLQRGWRKADIKLTIDGAMHVLRWRRGFLADQVFFDDREVARAEGLFSRETIFGLAPRTEAGEEIRLILSIDPRPDYGDWSGSPRIWGVRLETAEAVLLAVGSFGPDRMEPFRQLYDRTVKALGLAGSDR